MIPNAAAQLEQRIDGIIHDEVVNICRDMTQVQLDRCGPGDLWYSIEQILEPDEFVLFKMHSTAHPDDGNRYNRGYTKQYNGYSQAEIAEYFGISQQAVSKRIAKIKTKLRERL